METNPPSILHFSYTPVIFQPENSQGYGPPEVYMEQQQVAHLLYPAEDLIEPVPHPNPINYGIYQTHTQHQYGRRSDYIAPTTNYPQGVYSGAASHVDSIGYLKGPRHSGMY